MATADELKKDVNLAEKLSRSIIQIRADIMKNKPAGEDLIDAIDMLEVLTKHLKELKEEINE